MSREIKFRVFLDATKYEEWHEDCGKKFMISWKEMLEGVDAISEYFTGGILGCSEPMQFTGLQDANGVEIYEGDIVEYWEIYKNFSDAVEMHDVEPQNNFPVNEIYAQRMCGEVEFIGGRFVVNDRVVFDVADDFRSELLDLHYDGCLNYGVGGLREFVQIANEFGLKSPIAKNCAAKIIGNIHQNPELLTKQEG